MDANSDGPADSATTEDAAIEADARVRCPPGQEPCGAAGCVDPTRDPDHCGACDTPCAATGVAQRACVAGECKPSCDTEHVDCNEEGRDGCEADLRTDPDNCGACDARCSDTGVTATGRVCTAGVCRPICLTTHRDCNGLGGDGCEINVRTNVDHCGACSRACSPTNVASRTCSAGLCESTCSLGRGNCVTPAAPAADDGCERDLTRPTDCGACAHDCQGSTCAQLMCQAAPLQTGVSNAVGLAATDEHVYYGLAGTATDTGSMFRVPFLGGEPEELFSVEVLSWPSSIVTDGEYLYWCQSTYQREGIFRSDGPTFVSASTFLDAQDIPYMTPWSMSEQGGYLYWADIVTHRVYRSPIAASASPIALTPDTAAIPADVVVDSQHVYYVLHDAVVRVPLGGGAVPVKVPGSMNSPAALTDTHVYYTGMITGGGLPQYQVLRLPKSLQGTPESLTLVAAPPSPMVTHGGYLYFGFADGIYRLPQVGGTPLRVATQVSNLQRMVVHNGVLFWTNRGASAGAGSVYRMVLSPG